MKTIRRFAIASVALALGLPAVAQNADTTATAPTGQNGYRANPSRTVHNNTGSAKAILAPYGTYITQTGVGSGGADVSEIEPGFNTYGWGMQGGTINNRLADDFTVDAGGWTVSNYKWLTYQTGAPTSGTITGMNMNLWDGAAGPLGGATVAFSGPTSSLLSQVWTGVYRVTSTTLASINRAMIEVDNDASWASSLTGGKTYWLDTSATGLLSSGPWGPVVVPQSSVDNAQQFLGSSGTWTAVVDGLALLPQGMLFQVEGSGGGIGTFCTSLPAGGLAGCTSTLSGTGTSASKSGGAGSYTLTASPAPGGPQAGVFIWAKSLIATPVFKDPNILQSAGGGFGWRCIIPTRGSPDLPGGTAGQCNGQYDWDLGAYLAGAGSGLVNVGDDLYVQGWYRDPTYTAGALFTQGVGPINITP